MTPTISVPLPDVQQMLAWATTGGVNGKAKIAEMLKGKLDEYTTKLESEVVDKHVG